MTSQLRCDGCGRRFGKRARPLLLFSTFVLCAGCADSIAIHVAVSWLHATTFEQPDNIRAASMASGAITSPLADADKHSHPPSDGR
jgi:hypothetical protein